MPKIDETVIGFAVYEDATEYIGISEVTLPEISNITEEISGAGIGGKIESVILGAIEAMSLTLNFRTVTNNAIKLHEPRQHNIDLRAAQQQKDTVKGTTEVVSVKHILVVTPKKLNPGKVATAAAAEVSGEYAVSYYATYIDGKKKLEIDPLNYIYYVNGKDYLADVRKALGKLARAAVLFLYLIENWRIKRNGRCKADGSSRRKESKCDRIGHRRIKLYPCIQEPL